MRRPRIVWPRLNIFRRIGLGYILVLLVVTSTGLLIYQQLQSLEGTHKDITQVEIPALQAMDDIRVQVLDEEAAVTRFTHSSETVRGGDESLIQPYFPAHQRVSDDLDRLYGYHEDAQVFGLLATLADQIHAQAVRWAQEIDNVRAGQVVEPDPQTERSGEAIRRTADELASVIRRHLNTDLAEADEAAAKTFIVIVALFLAAAALTAGAGYAIARSISRPLTRLTRTADRIAAGEDVTPTDGTRGDEIGVLSRALTRMLSTLQQQAGELTRSNEELEQFAYVASHDLQEPLRMVSSYASLLRKRYQGKLDADADEFIGYAVDGAMRMQALINDLLTYSGAGREPKPSEPTDAGAALDRALRNLEVAISEKAALVSREPLPEVMANPLQLSQLFQNLIGNAIKFCKDRRPEIRISAQRRGAEWVFCVRDNGIGIDSKYADRIFLIFQRLHRREEYPGTGIGLAICKKIVERHGGRIWLESQPGDGAAFYFTFKSAGGAQLAA